ncbi:MAG: Uma2 family endonuclease [Chloroflexi bacterium]|nr:Uma2 family endonuclease [Chloroflexota bacterium]
MVAQPFGNSVSKLQAEHEDPTIEYPCEDDEPLAETEYQYEPLTYAVAALKAHFSDCDDVYAQGDMFVYYRMNDPRSVIAPDVFVVFGALDNHKRNSWLTWREGGRQPNFVLEIASESTWHWDASGKRDIYARIGVDEYWRFDPTGECINPVLIGERLVNGEYHPIEVTDEDGTLRGRSDVLNLDICVRDELELRPYDPVGGEWLMYYQEAQDALQAERAAREAAEQRIFELEAQLTRQQNNDSS